MYHAQRISNRLRELSRSGHLDPLTAIDRDDMLPGVQTDAQLLVLDESTGNAKPSFGHSEQ